MKQSFTRFSRWTAICGAAFLLTTAAKTRAQGTSAFSYQGQLRDNGTNANGAYTMIFKLYEAATSGNQIGIAITNSPGLANGLFTVNLDFGLGAFNGSARWLDIAVVNGGVAETLSPRVQILPAPYALMAGTASSALTAATASSVAAANVTGTLADARLSGNVAMRSGGNAFTGDQTLTSGSLGIGGSPTESLLISGGNAFIIGANSSYPGASGSLFFGSDSTTRDGALLRTTAGDLALWRYTGVWSETMRILNSSGNVGIGQTNPATALDVNGTVTATSFSGSGAGLTSLPDAALSGNVALRAGGNAFSGNQTFTGGSVGIGTTTPLGYSLDIRGSMSLPAGSAGSIYFDGANASGQEWQLFHNASEAFGPVNGLVIYNGTAQSSELVISPSGKVGIGKISPATALDVNGTVTATSFSGSGAGLTSLPDGALSSNVALRAGGNAFTGDQTISGGSIGIGASPTESLLINGGNALIVGANAGAPGAGGSLFLGSDSSTRDSALLRTTAGDMAFWRYNGVWNETMRLLRSSGNVGIGRTNPATALDVNGTVTATSFSGSGAGLTSLPDGALSSNVALRSGGNAFGGNQTITGNLDIHGPTSVPAGSAGSIYFDGANATGQEWQLFHNASEAFGPVNGLVIYNGTAQSSELVIAPSGNVGIGKTSPATALDVNGTVTCVSVNQTSDRNAKENFSPLSPEEVLAKVAGLSITRWNFKGDERTPHVGPMAQDFYQAFNVGADDKHISTVDEGGVALAAIQGLNEKLEVASRNSEARIQDLEAENSALKARLQKLEQLVNTKNGDHQ